MAYLALFLLSSFTVYSQEEGESYAHLWRFNTNGGVENSQTKQGVMNVGERIDLAHGSIDFYQTDISLPGNSNLPVKVARYKYGLYADPADRSRTFSFRDWELDVPSIYTRVSDRILGGETGNICSTEYVEKPAGHHQIQLIEPLLIIDGVKKALYRIGADVTSHSYKADAVYFTKDNWSVTCIKIAGDKEGFMATSPKGVNYYFEHMNQQRYLHNSSGGWYYWDNHYLYRATRVEDKFGNWVEYNYQYDTPEVVGFNGRPDNLLSIVANDGRMIELKYENPELPTHVTKAVVGERAWEYIYKSETQVGNNNITVTYWRLHKVKRPDNNYLEFEYTGAVKGSDFARSGPDMPYNYEGYRYDADDQFVIFEYTITTPGGAEHSFQEKAYPAILNMFLDYNYNKGGNASGLNLYWESLPVSSFITQKKIKTATEEYTWNYQLNADSFIVKGNYKPISKQKIVTISGPTGIEKHYFPAFDEIIPYDYEKSQFWRQEITSENKLLEKTEYLDLNNNLERTVNYSYDFFQLPGSVCNGNGTYCWHQKSQFDGELAVIDKVVTSQNGTDYTWQVESFNNYQLPEKVKSFNSIPGSSPIFTVNNYFSDVSSYILNLPINTQISNTDSSYTMVNEVEYYPSEHATYANLPKYEKSFGTWQKYYKSYDKGNVTRIEYNQSLKSGTGTGNRYTEFSSYYRGIPRGIKTAGRTTSTPLTASRSVDYFGKVISVTDFNNNTTGYTYDDIGQLKAIKSPTKAESGNWLDTLFTWSYDGGDNSGQPVHTEQRCTLNANKDGCSDTPKLTTTTTFDGLLRPLLTKTSDGTTTLYQHSGYNVNNQLTKQSYPSTTKSDTAGNSWSYDGLQRLESQSQSGGGSINYEYLAGNKIKTTDGENNVTTITYLAYGAPSYDQAIKIASPESVTTDIAIDIYGNVNSIKQSGFDNSTAVELTEYRAYDSQKRLCQIARDDVGTTVFSRNTIGEIEWMAQGQTANSNTTCNTTANAADKVSFVYDNLGAKYTVSYGDSTPKSTYTLDGNGNVTNITDGSNSQGYGYNSLNQITGESLSISGRAGGNLTLDYTYDNLGSLDTITYPYSEVAINYVPNAFGQPTQAIRTNADTSTDEFVKTGATYHPSGTINSFTYGNGIKHETTLDTMKRPKCIRDYAGATSDCGTGNIVSLDYGFDNNSNITSITNGFESANSLTSLVYDGLDRLTNTTAGAQTGIGSSTITYDGLGNIQTYSNTGVAPQALTYNYTDNLLTSLTGNGSSGYTFNSDSYDTRGNVVDNGKHSFEYNLANQMTEANGKSYSYDGYNRRIKQEKNDGTVEYSMYSQSGKLMYRETSDGGINYIFFGNKLVAKEGFGVKEPNETTGETSIVNSKPFGENVETTRDSVGYTGHKFDKDLGLNYMQARYYDPVIGRFYSNDPVGFTNVHTFNRYAYANNNPYRYTDPDGNSPISVLAKQTAKVGIKQGIQNMGKRQMRRLGRYMNQGQRKDFMSDVADVLGSLDSSPLEIAFELIPVAGDIYGAGKFGKQVASAYGQMQNLENKWAEKIYNSLPADQKKKFVNAMRNAGVRDAKQDAGLPRTGSGLEGHHVDHVVNNKAKMSDPRNIKMLTPPEHKNAHGN